ncbi:hypothetical protein WN51_03090 [Melipona quadrifasciata]|uniref:Uncharacterized protein n=1 Tax=Melipona quadrifasciata TaxID=166423 RepID=A0A0M8ZWR6_9HYME|nr:hypothetical protein WN51_03090 [Melipona quadrifasciata]
MVKSGTTPQNTGKGTKLGIEGAEDGKIIENFWTVKPVGWVERQRCLGWATQPFKVLKGTYYQYAIVVNSITNDLLARTQINVLDKDQQPIQAQGVYGSVVGRYRQSRRRKDAAGRSQDQPGKGQPAEPGGNDEEEKREATRRNGYEEIPPPYLIKPLFTKIRRRYALSNLKEIQTQLLVRITWRKGAKPSIKERHRINYTQVLN